MGSVTVSAKIPEELRERLREYDISVSETFRKALERELREREREILMERADEISAKLKGKISRDDIVKAVRWTREEC